MTIHGDDNRKLLSLTQYVGESRYFLAVPKSSDSPGGRLKEVRDALKLTQSQFAHRMTIEAERQGLARLYDTAMVSKIETGVRALGLEDGLVLAALDPEQRGIRWVATGDLPRETVPKTTAELAARSGAKQPPSPPEKTKAAPGRAANDRRKGG